MSVTAVILLSAQTMLYRRVPLEKPPEALAERARDILQSVGYSEPPVDTAMGFYEGNDFLRYIAATRQIEDALGQPRDRGVRVLVSRQPPALPALALVLLLGCTHIGSQYGRTTRRWMCPG